MVGLHPLNVYPFTSNKHTKYDFEKKVFLQIYTDRGIHFTYSYTYLHVTIFLGCLVKATERKQNLSSFYINTYFLSCFANNFDPSDLLFNFNDKCDYGKRKEEILYHYANSVDSDQPA